MRRFAELRSSLLSVKPCRSAASSRFYSKTHNENTDIKTRKRRIKKEKPLIDKKDHEDPGFGDWSEVNSNEKTIETAIGSLPLSPLLDSTWREARQRKKVKPLPDESKFTRFQRKLNRNPYAQLLAEPVRSCQVTKTRLPRSFLQGFGLVEQPRTNKLWWIPADFSQPKEEAASQASGGEVESATPAASDDNPATRSKETAPDNETVSDKLDGHQVTHNRRFSNPVHSLARQDLLQEFLSRGTKYSSGHMRFGTHPSIGSAAKVAIWREDMDSVIPNQLRRQIMRELLYLSELCETADRKYLVKVDSAEDSAPYSHRECFLQLDQVSTGPFRILEIEGALESARPVYNLPSLLGPEATQQLTTEASAFREGTLFLLRGQRSIELSKKLWRLEGYVAKYNKLK